MASLFASAQLLHFLSRNQLQFDFRQISKIALSPLVGRGICDCLQKSSFRTEQHQFIKIVLSPMVGSRFSKFQLQAQPYIESVANLKFVFPPVVRAWFCDFVTIIYFRIWILAIRKQCSNWQAEVCETLKTMMTFFYKQAAERRACFTQMNANHNLKFASHHWWEHDFVILRQWQA